MEKANVIKYGDELNLIDSINKEISSMKELLECSIMENNIDILSNDFMELENSIERYRNICFDNEDKDNIKIKESFYYGYALSLLNIGKNLIKKTKEIKDLEIVNNYSLLIDVMKAIDKKGNLSAKDLSKELNIKSLSSFNNMYDRVKDYNFIKTEKIARKRYYFLTTKGKEALRNLDAHDKKDINEDDVIFFINKLCESIENGETNELKVVSGSFVDRINKNNKYIITTRVNKVLNAKKNIDNRRDSLKRISYIDKYENDYLPLIKGATY